MKKVVWDICGGLNGSVGLAIGYEKYDIHTIDILPKTKDGRKNIVIDLTQDIKVLIPKLEKLPKPYIIGGSPMCMSFSTASSFLGSGASGWDYVNHERKEIEIRSKENFEYANSFRKSKYSYERAIGNAKSGMKVIDNLLLIIQWFKPKHWYIENPSTSLIWNYIEYNKYFKGIKNLVHYINYGALNRKPTYFFSNIKLDLNYNISIKNQVIWENVLKNDRSDIPKRLLQEIFKQFENPYPQQIELFK